MLTQYTRIYYDSATGVIKHCHTSNTPFEDGFEPIESDDGSLSKMDVELQTSAPDLDFGPDQTIIGAGDILANLEVSGTAVQAKTGAPAGMFLSIRKRASLERTAVKQRLKSALMTRFSDDPDGGMTAVRKIRNKIREKLGEDADFDDLRMTDMLRLLKRIQAE